MEFIKNKLCNKKKYLLINGKNKNKIYLNKGVKNKKQKYIKNKYI